MEVGLREPSHAQIARLAGAPTAPTAVTSDITAGSIVDSNIAATGMINPTKINGVVAILGANTFHQHANEASLVSFGQSCGANQISIRAIKGKSKPNFPAGKIISPQAGEKR